MNRVHIGVLLGTIAGTSWSLSGCVAVEELRARASSDLNCPTAHVAIKRLESNTYEAEGCGEQKTYLHTWNGWQLESASAGDAESSEGDSDATPQRRPSPMAKDTGKEKKPEWAQGSGFVVDDTGSILTANHVVEGAERVTVQCGRDGRATARVLKRDVRHDLALLRSDHPSPGYLLLGSSAAAALGEQVFTVGFPVSPVLGSEPKFTEGAISSLKGIQDSNDLFQISVPIQPGNSGGPLVGKDGTVIGVITSTASVRVFFEATGTLPQGVNWAVKSDLARFSVHTGRIESAASNP